MICKKVGKAFCLEAIRPTNSTMHLSNDINVIENNKLNSEELIGLRNKVDLLLEQHEATQKAICRLRGDLPSIIKEVFSTILKKRARCSIL